MSIIIKGMDMPKKDTGCRIIILYDGQVAMDDGTYIPEYQAVEIPTPHGRLVEGDVVANMLRDILTYIDEETILEAEE